MNLQEKVFKKTMIKSIFVNRILQSIRADKANNKIMMLFKLKII